MPSIDTSGATSYCDNSRTPGDDSLGAIRRAWPPLHRSSPEETTTPPDRRVPCSPSRTGKSGIGRPAPSRSASPRIPTLPGACPDTPAAARSTGHWSQAANRAERPRSPRVTSDLEPRLEDPRERLRKTLVAGQEIRPPQGVQIPLRPHQADVVGVSGRILEPVDLTARHVALDRQSNRPVRQITRRHALGLPKNRISHGRQFPADVAGPLPPIEMAGRIGSGRKILRPGNGRRP